jgi:hypothetical protein
MCKRQTLEEFLTYAKENVIADRYILVMWDHGEGTLGGFGRDELNDNASLSIVDMKAAIKSFGQKLDVMVFDACLMGTVENACALSDSGKYLIASEDITPTDGIYYTTWLNSLSSEPCMSNEELARLIVDSFVVHAPKGREDVMMSVINLDNMSLLTNELSRILPCLNDKAVFEKLVSSELDAYGENEGNDQYDLLSVFDAVDMDISDLAIALESTLYYKRSAVDGKYSGLALYLPIARQEEYKNVRNVLCEAEYPEGLISVLDTINETNGG